MRSLNTPLALTLLAVAALPLLACDQFQARLDFKAGNAHYKEEKYKAALSEFQTGLALDPTAYPMWRSVGLAAMALYRPGNDSPANVAYANTAVEAFKKYLQHYPNDIKVQEYLLTTLMNAKRFDDVIANLREEARKHPEDKTAKRKVIDVMVRQGKWQEAFDLVDATPRDYGWEPYFLISVYCWDKSYRDPNIDLATRTRVVDLGMKSVAKAVALNPESYESVAYYNLLYREKAKIEPDEKKQEEYLAEADKWREKAIQLIEAKKKKEQGATAKPASS